MEAFLGLLGHVVLVEETRETDAAVVPHRGETRLASAGGAS
jgi:hypothetical protein